MNVLKRKMKNNQFFGSTCIITFLFFDKILVQKDLSQHPAQCLAQSRNSVNCIRENQVPFLSSESSG